MLRPTSSDLEMTAATNGEEKGCVWTGALPTGGGGNNRRGRLHLLLGGGGTRTSDDAIDAAATYVPTTTQPTTDVPPAAQFAAGEETRSAHGAECGPRAFSSAAATSPSAATNNNDDGHRRERHRRPSSRRPSCCRRCCCCCFCGEWFASSAGGKSGVCSVVLAATIAMYAAFVAAWPPVADALVGSMTPNIDPGSVSRSYLKMTLANKGTDAHGSIRVKPGRPGCL